MMKHVDEALYRFPEDYVDGLLDTVGVYFTKNFAMNTVTLVLQGGHLTLTDTLNRTQGWKTSAIANSSDIA